MFNGRISEGRGLRKSYRDLSEMPVLLKAGGIVPMAVLGRRDLACGEKNDSADNCKSGCSRRINYTGNPAALRVLVGGGADGEYTLYEDDGISMNFEKGAYATTKFKVHYDAEAKTTTFTVNPAVGDLSLIPENRSYEIEFYGIKADSVTIRLPEVPTATGCTVTLTNVELLENDYKQLVFEILDKAWIKMTDKDMVYGKLQNLDRSSFAKWLNAADISENLNSAINEVLI